MNWTNPPPRSKQKKKPILGKTTRVPLHYCKECGHKLDSTSGFMHNRKPKKGSLTICIRCGHLYILNKDLTLREMNDKEVVDWAGRPELIAISRIVAELKVRRAVDKMLKKQDHS